MMDLPRNPKFNIKSNPNFLNLILLCPLSRIRIIHIKVQIITKQTKLIVSLIQRRKGKDGSFSRWEEKPELLYTSINGKESNEK